MIPENFFLPGGQSAADQAVMRLRMIPQISRARDFRLYTTPGRKRERLLDLWQYGGRAILGHTPPSVLRELKNTAERGLFAPFPSHLEGRFRKALSTLLPGRVFRLYKDEAALRLDLLLKGLVKHEAGPFPDPAGTATAAADPSRPQLWRPFLDAPIPAAPLIPVLPLPWEGAPWALAVPAAPPPPDAPLSPGALAAATRAVYDLIAAPCRAPAAFPKLDRVLARSGVWTRRGCYLTLKEPPDEEAYTALFRRFLDRGCLIPPSPAEPLIVPGVLSPGEEAALADLFNKKPQ
jgi:hypothetical protein